MFVNSIVNQIVFLSALWALLALSNVAPALGAVPDLEDYMRELEVRDISMSPDGKKLAIIKRVKEDQFRLEVIDVENNDKSISITEEPPGKTVTDIQWLNNNRLGLTISARQKYRRGTAGYKRLLVMDADGTNALMALSDQERLSRNSNLATIVSTLPLSPDYILMTGYEKNLCLYRVDIKTGSSQKTVCGDSDTFAFRVDKNGVPRLRVDFNSDTMTASLFSYNPETGRWSKIDSYRLRDPDDVEEAHDRWMNVDGETNFLMVERIEGEEYAKLHRYDLTTREHLGVAFEVDGYDIDGVMTDDFSNQIMGVRYIADRPRFVFFDDENQRVQRHLEGQFPSGAVEIFSISSNQNTYLFHSGEPSRRGSLYLYNDRTGAARELIDLAPHFKGMQTTLVKEIRYHAKDETLIEGYLTYPASTALENLPLIVFPHGGPQARDWLEYDTFVQYWATRGYAVFQPNFRGSAGYGRRFEEAGYHEYGGAMIDDIASGVQELSRMGVIDSERVCVAGASYGGYAALMLAIKYELVKCVVSINGLVDLKLRVKNGSNKYRDKKARKAWRDTHDEIMGNPDTQPELFRTQSPNRRAREMSAPVLLIHAEDDSNVSLEHSKRMFNALRKAKKKVRFLRLPYGGHSLLWDDSKEKVLQETEAFFAEYLKVPAQDELVKQDLVNSSP